jgi:hypothetical protein
MWRWSLLNKRINSKRSSIRLEARRLLGKKIDKSLQTRQERSCGAQSDGEKSQSNTSTRPLEFS